MIESIHLFLEIDYFGLIAPIMGVFGFGGSSSKSSSSSTVEPDILELVEGVFGDQSQEIRDLAVETLQSIRAGQGRGLREELGGFNFQDFVGSSAVGQQLQETLLNPSFSPSGTGEQSIVNSIRDQILGSTALKGLRPTTGGITQGLAPILQQLRQSRIQNLSGAFQTELGGALAGRGQDITQRGQTLGAGQEQVDSALNSFLSLLSLGRQTPVIRGGGATSTGSSTSGGLGLNLSGLFDSNGKR